MHPIHPPVRRFVVSLCAGVALLAARHAAAQADPRCMRVAEAATDTPEVTAAGDTTFGTGQVDAKPELTNEPLVLQLVVQNYPRALRDQRVSGCAVVRVRVSADGAVDRRRPQVVYATQPEFGVAAATVARRMKFSPATRGGRPVAAWFEAPVSFLIMEP